MDGEFDELFRDSAICRWFFRNERGGDAKEEGFGSMGRMFRLLTALPRLETSLRRCDLAALR